MEGGGLPDTAQARLLPVESDRAWGLEVLGGRVSPEPAATAEIDASGRYCLPVPGRGMWEVVLEVPGLMPMTYSPLPVSEPIDLPPAQLARDAGARVEVRDAASRPTGGVWVTARSATPRLLGKVAGSGWRLETRVGRSDGEGRVVLPRLPGEELELEAFWAGSAQVATGRARATGRLELPPPAAVRTLEVRNQRGEALPGVLVTLAEYGWPVAVSDEEGRVTLAGGGTAALLLQGDGGRSRRVELPAGAEDGGPARLELPAGAPVRGRVVVGGDQRSVEGARVWLGHDPGAFVVSGSDGQYALPAGGRERSWVWAEAPGLLPGAVPLDSSDEAAGLGPTVALQGAITAAGRVVDGSGSPLPGTVVEAMAAGAERPAPPPAAGASSRAVTDQHGRFELPRLRPGTAYEVAATRAGFSRLVVPVGALPPEPVADLGALVLEPGAAVAGRVTDLRGRPLEAAELRFRPAAGPPGRGEADRLRERPPDAVAGPDGRFVLADLAPGRPLHLLASRAGYLPAWTLGVEPPSTEPLTVVLEDASRLAGTLVDVEGTPVPGARIGLRWLGPPAGTVGLEPRRGGGSRAAATGPEGEFSFEELAPGEVEVSALAEAFLPSPPETVELPLGGEVSGLRLVLRRGAVLEGRVLDPRGEPISGARLRIGPADATSDADGRYRLAGLTPGPKGLLTYHPDFRERLQEVLVEPGTNAEDVYLEEGWRVSGRTVDEAGAPLAGARVELRAEDPRARSGRTAESGEDGRFALVASEEGPHRLTATREGFSPGELAGLEVGAAPLEGLEVRLSRGTSMVGRILGLELGELAGVAVEARREDGLGSSESVVGAVDQRGRYAIHHLAPGIWRIRAELAGGRRQAEATVALESGTRQLERDLELGAGLRFAGRLLYAGEPVAAAHVSLTGLDLRGERSVLSAHDGGFRIEDLSPGRYRLDVLDPSRALSHLEDLELTADRDVVLELEAAPLVGTVRSAESGEPLAEALVYVYKLVEGGERGSLVTVGTDAAGSFVVAHVSPGSYLVSARKDGYAPADRPVEVAAGASPAPVDLRLTAAGGLTLAVSLESGAIPRFATVSAFDPTGRKLLTDTRAPTDRGFVHFEQIPAGAWNLLVSAPEAAPAWVRVEVPGTAPRVVLPSAAPLVVRVPALMESGAAGTLTLASPAGEPFFQVEPGGELRSRWNVSAGLVTLPEVPAGSWSVRVDGARGGTWLATAITDGRTPSQVSLE